MALLIIAAAASSGGDDPASDSGSAATSRSETRASEPSASTETSEEPTSEAPPADDALTDDDWTLGDVQVTEQSGVIGVVARITNNADEPRTAVFTISFLRNGDFVASTQGAASGEVGPGETATVQFIGFLNGEIDAGQEYDYELQVDF